MTLSEDILRVTSKYNDAHFEMKDLHLDSIGFSHHHHRIRINQLTANGLSNNAKHSQSVWNLMRDIVHFGRIGRRLMKHG